MMQKRLKSMEKDENGLGLNKSSALYMYLEGSYHYMVTYNPLTKENDEEA